MNNERVSEFKSTRSSRLILEKSIKDPYKCRDLYVNKKDLGVYIKSRKISSGPCTVRVKKENSETSRKTMGVRHKREVRRHYNFLTTTNNNCYEISNLTTYLYQTQSSLFLSLIENPLDTVSSLSLLRDL